MDVVRITELQPKTYVEQGDYIAIDNQSDGTKKVQFTNLLDDTLSQENKIAPANVVGDKIATVRDTMEDEIATIRAAVGSPLKASTVAQMTDKNKIYVYVGSESGYTNGNWYYWNGSAWTSGGVYNSVAVVTDPTLTLSGVPADAKVTGDEIGNLKSDLIGANLFQSATLVTGKAWVDYYEVTNASYNYYYGINVVAGAKYVILPKARFIYIKKGDGTFEAVSTSDATSFIAPVSGIAYVTVYASDNNFSLMFTNTDITLTQDGKNADAKVTGDKIQKLNSYSLENSLFAFAEDYVIGQYYNGSAINNPTYNYYASIPVFKDHLYSFSDEVRFVIVEQNNVVKETYENIEYFTCLNDGVAFVTIRADKPNITMQRLILNDFFSSLTNKKMVCLGDSFTAGDTYVNKIAKRCDCVSLNYGVPSSRIVRDVEGAQSFNSRYSSMPDDADVVTIFGGINDAYDVKIGVLPMGTIESVADLTTFYGGMKKLIEGIIAKYPDKQIIGIVPPDCQVADYNRLPLVQNAEREIYNYYGIPFIDIKRECYKMSTLPDMVALYRQDASNIHPSADGHVALADTIFAGLKRYLP